MNYSELLAKYNCKEYAADSTVKSTMGTWKHGPNKIRAKEYAADSTNDDRFDEAVSSLEMKTHRNAMAFFNNPYEAYVTTWKPAKTKAGWSWEPSKTVPRKRVPEDSIPYDEFQKSHKPNVHAEHESWLLNNDTLSTVRTALEEPDRRPKEVIPEDYYTNYGSGSFFTKHRGDVPEYMNKGMRYQNDNDLPEYMARYEAERKKGGGVFKRWHPERSKLNEVAQWAAVSPSIVDSVKKIFPSDRPRDSGDDLVSMESERGLIEQAKSTMQGK